MDYAKLALLKAEELRKKGENKQITDRVGISPDKSVTAGQSYEICRISGGAVSIIVSLSLSGGKGDVELRAGNRTLLVRPYCDNMLFMASLNTSSFFTTLSVLTGVGSAASGEVSLCIRPSSSLRLLSAEVMVLGGNVKTEGGAAVRLAVHEGKSAAVWASEGRVRFCLGDNAALPDLSRYHLAGFGDCAAVAGITIADKTYFAVCYAGAFDSVGGPLTQASDIKLTLFSSEGRIVACKNLPIKATAIALIGADSYLILGYVANGVAHAAVIAPPDFVPELCVEIEEATSLEFVRGLPSAVFLEKSNGRILRLSRSEIPSDECIALFLDASIE